MTGDITTPDEGWAARISACWRRGAESIIEAGRLLAAAKAALEHGAFTTLIETSLPFGSRTAQRLMAIAADERLSNPTRVSLLPPSWGAMYELTRLDDEQLDKSFAEGAIKPDMERAEAVAIVVSASSQTPTTAG
jgi:hypothetical protein